MPEENIATPGSATEAYLKSVADGHQGKRRGCAPLRVAHALLGTGVALAVAGIAYGVALPRVITSKIESGVATCKVEDVQKESFVDQYGDCESCTPYYMNMYMFNVTNAMAYLEKGEKIKMTEVGPYVYRRRQFKVDVKLSDDTNQVSYKMYTYHTFDASKSCTGCKDTDQVISVDLGYVNVVSQAGGELGYLRRLVKGTLWGKGLTDEAREEIVQANKEQLMRWTNGLNSNQPSAWKKLSGTIMEVLGTGISGIGKLDLSGFEYNGLFAKRPISDWALGYPSMLAGIGLGTNYKNECEKGANYNAKCASCTAATCPEIWSECKRCASGAKVVKGNTYTCGRIISKYAAVYGEAEAKAVNSSACGLCDLVGLCVAPLPGVAESSGVDYSKNAPNVTNLNTYIQRTGCDDYSKIGEYIQYDGFTAQPVWASLDTRRNPTLAEMAAFTKYANCAAKTDNTTCVTVMGNDGASTPPLGASITGFPDKAELESNTMYLGQLKQNISLQNTGETFELDGALLTRFEAASDLLKYADWKAARGTGIPVDGVQSMAFGSGLLAYVSLPMFLTGDKSLLENVEVTMFDGKVASNDVLYDTAGKLKKEYYDRYQTYVDVEPGTGKAMRARKRLMASYAVAKSQYTPNAPMTDVLWPKIKPEVILPAYFGEESVTVTSKRLEQFKSIKAILGSVLPVLIVALVVGVALAAFGLLKRRRAVANANAAKPVV